MPPPAKRPRHDHNATAPPPEGAANLSVNKLKREIRSLTRLLTKNAKLSPSARIECERALAANKADLVEVEAANKRKKMISKYHMVRFFERKKAERVLKRAKKAKPIEDEDKKNKIGNNAMKEWRKRVHEAEVDLNYTIYCPLDAVYISLYPGKEDHSQHRGGDEDEAIQGVSLESTKKDVNGTQKDKPPIWHLVEESMAAGTLDSLRDGSLTKPAVSTKPDVKAKSQSNASGHGDKGSSSHKRKREEQDKESENGSDFFDE